jgi:uncharacterized membrane protein YqjE
MATEVESNGEASVTTLMSGIVQDARELFVEQMTLFQVEIKNDIRRAVTGLAPLLMGAGVSFISLLLLGIGAAHLLAWAVPDMPLWVAFGLTGGALAIVGTILVLWGVSILEKIHGTPDTALKALKENLQWKTKN